MTGSPGVAARPARPARRPVAAVAACLLGVVAGVAWAVSLATAPTPARPAAGRLVAGAGTLAASDGRQVRPLFGRGINIYDLTSDWDVNVGCGYGAWTPAQVDGVLGSLPPGALVRTWFFEPMAVHDGRLDWSALDRAVHAADRHHLHLIATLANQNGDCDESGWKSPGWYRSGYLNAGSPLPYLAWARAVAARYRDDAGLAVIEPVNEPEPTACVHPSNCYSPAPCPDDTSARSALREFFDVVGGWVHFLAPQVLVSDGGLGTGNCGTRTPADFSAVWSSPGLDVTTYHDYVGPAELPSAVPPDLRWRAALARRLGHPTVVTEAGITGCASAEARAAGFAAEMHGAAAAGASGYLMWWYGGDGGRPSCDSPIDVDSPTWRLLR